MKEADCLSVDFLNLVQEADGYALSLKLLWTPAFQKITWRTKRACSIRLFLG